MEGYIVGSRDFCILCPYWGILTIVARAGDNMEIHFKAFVGDSGGPAFPNHFQCGGGNCGTPLGLAGGVIRVRYISLGWVVAMPRRFLLFRRRTDSFNQPLVVAGED